MIKYNAGLHKKVSSIFDGVAISQKNTEELPKQQIATIHTTCDQQKRVSGGQPIHHPGVVKAKKPRVTGFIKDERAIVRQGILSSTDSRPVAVEKCSGDFRRKFMTVLIPVLSAVLIFVIFNSVVRGPSRATRKQTVGAAKAVASSTNKIDWQVPDPYPATLRDPMQFASGVKSQGAKTELVVKGIVYSNDNPSAVVGDKIVYRGEEISGAIVKNIDKGSVEFEMDGRIWKQGVQK